ncbi:formate dehydrogenase major subunit [Desulfacinum hydrothermale DSM 13146]|nr:formate dehydrogenase major subunit [Desulfacinum hydrothermale DSM 13146]
MTNSLADMDRSECLFVIGSNTTETHPMIAKRILRAVERGAALIVADPRHIQLARFATVAVRHRPGTDVALLCGLMHLIVRNNWHDQDYIRQRTEGFSSFERVLQNYPPERVAQITGVAVEDLVRMAEIYATRSPAAIYYAMGITQHTTGVDNVKACANLAMLCGNVGIPGGGVNPLRGQNNVQGACDMGGLPNVLPGYQPVGDEQVRSRFEEVWGTRPPGQMGKTIPEMIQGMQEGRIRALYVIGENPRGSEPHLRHLDSALEKLDLLIVQDIFATPTAQKADVVFAASAVAEKDGTFTNTERRCLRVRKAVDPPGEALEDWRILCRLADALGAPQNFEKPEDIFEEIRRVTPSYAGMTYARLGIDGLQWPCRTEDDPGTPILHVGSFARGRGIFHPVAHKEPAECPDDAYPFILSTGRMFAHYHTGTMTRASTHLDREQHTAYVEIHPKDAQTLSIEDGDQVRVSTRRGAVALEARVTNRVRPGMLFMPFHFQEAAANILTNPAADPVAKIPEYKACAAAIEKIMGGETAQERSV